MPVVLLVGFAVLMSLMDTFPWFAYSVGGVIAAMVMVGWLSPKSDERNDRLAQHRKAARAIDDERERAQVTEQALKNAYAETQRRISNMKRKRL